MPLNMEIKARARSGADFIRAALRRRGADFRGADEQMDTYFKVPVENGRLKLREGRIENALIHYSRVEDSEGPRRSDVNLFVLPEKAPELRTVLTAALGVLVVVKKTREIYFIGNVKIHLDRVEGLSESFVEIEAIRNHVGDASEDELSKQCQSLMDEFGLLPEDLISCSYSDMLRQQAGSI